MSLLESFRKKEDEIKRLKLENKILKEEIIILKKLLYGIELDKE